MKTIWKYKLETTDEQFIEMPKGSVILSVQIQKEELCLWALVDSAEQHIDRRLIQILGTGNPIKEEPRMFIGTYQIKGFVGHVFEYTGI